MFFSILKRLKATFAPAYTLSIFNSLYLYIIYDLSARTLLILNEKMKAGKILDS